jgi:hypothetical protein
MIAFRALEIGDGAIEHLGEPTELLLRLQLGHSLRSSPIHHQIPLKGKKYLRYLKYLKHL